MHYLTFKSQTSNNLMLNIALRKKNPHCRLVLLSLNLTDNTSLTLPGLDLLLWRLVSAGSVARMQPLQMGSVSGELLWCSKADSEAETPVLQLCKERRTCVGVDTMVCVRV